MIGIIITIAIGKYFHDLAMEYDKKKGLNTLIAVLMYIGIQSLIGLVALLAADNLTTFHLDSANHSFINVIALILSLLSIKLYYNYLKKRWRREYSEKSHEISDLGKY